MRVAIFSDNFYPELSGIADSVLALGKELAKRGHQVCYFAPAYGPADYAKANLPVGELELGENIKIVRLWSLPIKNSPTGQGRLVLPFVLSYRALRDFAPDIIHINLCSFLGLDAILFAKVSKIPILGTSHTPITEFIKYFPIRAKWFDVILNHFVAWFYNRANFVTGPSQFIFDEMKRYGFHRTGQPMSNLIDVSNFTPVTKEKKAELKKEFQLSDHVVLYAGRLAEEKHIDVIIWAIKTVQEKFPDVNLVVTGHGAGEFALKSLVKELNLEKNVKFTGTVPWAKLILFYQVSDIFAIASTAETQSISMLQAMSAGIPVVAVRAGALPEYVSADNGYLFEIGDFATLAERLIYLFNNEKERDRLGQGGVVTAGRYSIKEIAGQWENLFKKIINGYHK